MTDNVHRWKRVSLAAAMICGAFVAGVWFGPGLMPGEPGLANNGLLQDLLQQQSLRGATAAGSESFSMATGPIDDEVEGLYMLDAATGDLQCAVLNWRTAKFTALFRANVLAHLAIDPAKKPRYLMTTGAINFPRGATAARPGNSVVYVLETTTGNYAAYGIPWRRELAATGRPQTAALLLLDVGTARTAAIRE
jgi:hypothetical protein